MTGPATTHEARERRLTIGAVRDRLRDEFPDISISKIRYLEGQGLLAPRRTQSGYRLYSDEDVDRLRTILRLQRDEFLPLRVIRDELAAPGTKRRAARRRSWRASNSARNRRHAVTSAGRRSSAFQGVTWVATAATTRTAPRTATADVGRFCPVARRS